MREGESLKLSFWEHVGVLRSYILLGGGFFAVATIALFSIAGRFINTVLLAPVKDQQLVFLSPTGPLFFQLRVSFVGAMILSFPVWLFLATQFAAASLPKYKRRRLLWFVVVACVLGISALIVSYFFFVPLSFTALTKYVVPGTALMLTADSYLNFYLFVSALCFVIIELPVVLVALAYLGLLNPAILARQRRYLFIGLLVGLAMITPTTDVVTLLVTTIPAYVLIELGLVIAKMVYTK